jgi:ketosteroid isomerase-like protein
MTLSPAAATTEAVLGHHLQCLGAGDLEGVLADFAPDSVLCSPSGILRGPAAMRGLFQGFIDEFAKPGATFNLQQQSIEGEIAFITWTAETADNTYEFGTDTFVVRDGKILVQTFAGKITPKN